MKRSAVLALGLMTTGASGVAFGFAPRAHTDVDNHLEVADGRVARLQPNVTWSTPRDASGAWATFLDQRGGRWRAQWDADTKVPSRIYGEGIATPKASSDPAVAVAVATDALKQHLALLAPGADITDFELAANDADPQSGLRTVTFIQRHAGFEVVGGNLNVRIKNDRLFVFGSAALPNVAIELPRERKSTKTLEDAAVALVAKDAAGARLYAPAATPVILPIVEDNGRVRYHLVSEVLVHAEAPLGRWSVYLDVGTGREIARRQNLRFATGTIKFNAPERRPGATRLDWVARDADVTVAGQLGSTDANGALTWTGTGPLSGTVVPSGAEVNVSNDAGPRASFPFTLEDGGEVVWDGRNEEELDAQLNTFVASRIVKERARIIAPNLNWLSDPVEATVNIDSACNAFSDGTTINFFVSSRQCENTGRLADVVYHEYGHSFHAHVLIRGAGAFDTALSEGASDYLSGTITGDPGMGRGFFRTDAPLRHIDPAGSEAVWPEDVAEAHTTGLIFAGAMWDLRKQLIMDFGNEAQAVEHTDQLWHQALRRSSDIPSSYVEVLAADDDDGNLANGTPNNCAINEAFGRHGLADAETVAPPIGALSISPMLQVSLPVGTIENACPGASISDVSLDWRIRGQAAGGTMPMIATQTGYEEQLPSQTQGAVVQYRVEVTLDSGNKIFLPDNAADPYYEHFVGEVTQIYCSSFEGDPEAEGWTHALLEGEDREGADDWTYGPLQSPPGSGDPTQAKTGVAVAGNDLGGGNYNGRYQPGKKNILRSPVLPTNGFEVVRLQYWRWLNVEDGDFDQAEILANDQVVWSNFSTGSDGNTHHADKEWRFHDVEVTDAVRDGNVQIGFQLTTDRGLELGGWTIDDFCLVGYDLTPPAVCGNGAVEDGEGCDDGNLTSGDGCEADCTMTQIAPGCGNGVIDGGEVCDDGNTIGGDGCELDCTATPVDPTCSNPPCNPAVPGPDGDGLTQIDDAGCGCTATERSSGGAWLAGLFLVGLLARRRRR